MAEAFVCENNPEDTAISAGTDVQPENEDQPISKVAEKVVMCMEEIGIDVTDKKMNQLTKTMVDQADKVVSIVPRDTLPEYVQESPKLEVWDIPDASGTDIDFHRKVRDIVKEKVSSI